MVQSETNFNWTNTSSGFPLNITKNLKKNEISLQLLIELLINNLFKTFSECQAILHSQLLSSLLVFIIYIFNISGALHWRVHISIKKILEQLFDPPKKNLIKWRCFPLSLRFFPRVNCRPKSKLWVEHNIHLGDRSPKREVQVAQQPDKLRRSKVN